MYSRTNRIGAAIGATGLIVGCLAACTGTGSTKAGAQSAPVTLRIGTDDSPGRPTEGQITEFASQVNQLSGGSITIEPVWQAGGPDNPDWDQVVARMVVDGELDMGLIPARAWDTEGVTTLRALHAPFLVDSQPLLTAVVSGDLAAGMLSGLQADGVTGLALLPESLRHLFVFADGKSIADVDGQSVRAPTSATTEAMLTALGATVSSLSGAAFRAGVSDGSIFAADSGFPLAGTLPAPATVASDVVLFPKVNTLVIDNDALAELSDQQQDILRQAAAATLTWSIGSMPTESDGARQFCANGGTVVLAPDGEVERLLSATAPVYAMLEQDPTTKQQLDAITALKATLPAPVPAAACGPVADQLSSTPAEPDVSIDGVWRQDVTAEYLISAGLTPAKAADEAGVQTYTLQGGVLTLAYNDVYCTGTYAINGSRVTITGTTGCHFATAMTAEVTDDQITWTDAESMPPYTAPADQNEAAAFAGVPWTKVGGVAAPAADFPQGSYRAEITQDALVAAGVDVATATEHAGMWTLTFDDGALTVEDVNAATGNRSGGPGVYCVADHRVSLGQLGTPPVCGDFWSAEWTVDGDQLKFLDVQAASGGQTLIATLFGSVPFTRVG